MHLLFKMDEAELRSFETNLILRSLILNLEFRSAEECIKWLEDLPSENKICKEILHYMNAEDNPNCVRAIIEALSFENAVSSPLHRAAGMGAQVLTQVFLDYGQDPNIRLDYSSSLKDALPLDVALQNYRGKKFSDWDGSVFKLICLMCTHKMRHYLETARLLALQTKELDHEIFKYTKEGKVEHLCALMLLGYYSRILTVECFEGDESTKKQMLQLVEIFQRIGDKLQAYVTLQRPLSEISRAGRVVLDISSIFMDAGLPVKSIDTIMYSGRKKFVREDNVLEGKDNNSGREDRAHLPILHGLQGFNGSHMYMARNVTCGSHLFHTASITKVHKGLVHSSPSKGYVVSTQPPFWKKSSFWVMAFRRAIRTYHTKSEDHATIWQKKRMSVGN